MAEEITIESASEFVEKTQGLSSHLNPDQKWYFRGHGRYGWKLEPKVARSDFFRRNEKGYFEAWKRRAIEFVAKVPANDWEWLAVAQHHGLATRLLDWSHNPLVSLFFAAECEPKEDGCVWAYMPEFVVSATGLKQSPFERKKIAMFRPSAVSPRIPRQSGIFSVHCPKQWVIEDEIETLIRYKVPSKNKGEIMRELDFLGVNYTSLFPDLDGLSKHLNWIAADRDQHRITEIALGKEE